MVHLPSPVADPSAALLISAVIDDEGRCQATAYTELSPPPQTTPSTPRLVTHTPAPSDPY